MTLDTNLSKAVHQGNGVTTAFPFAFRVWSSGQLVVTMTDAAGTSTDVTGECAITLSDTGGSVTYPVSGDPLPTGAALAITRNMPFVQGVDLVSASRFDPQVIEDALDQAAAERQQTLEMMQRAVILPATSGDESPEDVVAAVYASRDAAAASASTAQTAAAAAELGASTAESTVQTATAAAVTEATTQATSAAASATAAQASADAAYAASEGMADRMDAVETVAAGAKAVTDTATATPTADAVAIADMSGKLDGWVTAKPLFYGTCDTASATADKIVTCSGFDLYTGAEIEVQFTNKNTVAGALTLDVNGTGAKPIAANDAVVSSGRVALFPDGCLIRFYYDGTYWRFQNTIVKAIYTEAQSGVQYADGKSVQWGALSASNQTVTVTLFYSYSTNKYYAGRNLGVQSTTSANGQESCCFNLTVSSFQTQVNTDHIYARWFTNGY